MGDGGSAFDIGRRAVAAVARARDGLAPPTRLDGFLLKDLACPDWDTLIARIARDADELLPSIFPLVGKAADGGDAVARRILSDSAKALSELAAGVIRRLGLVGEEFVLARVGGVFGVSRHLDAVLEDALRKVAPRARIEKLRVSPAAGAARLARNRASARQAVTRD